MEFDGKVILISGATGGMGKEAALRLSQEKCKLAIFARREEKLKEISEEINSKNAECIYKKCDVKNRQDVKEAVEFTLKKYGRIDIAFLTAGILIPNPIETFDVSVIKNTIDINFMGTIYLLEQILPIMKSQKSGTLAVVSSLADVRGVSGWGAYGASKAAISLFMESLRAEAKQKYNIDILTIKPGAVKTPMIEGYFRKGAVPAEKAATIILNGIKKGKKIIQFPLMQVIEVRATDLFPVSVYDKIPIELMRGEGYPDIEEK